MTWPSILQNISVIDKITTLEHIPQLTLNIASTSIFILQTLPEISANV